HGTRGLEYLTIGSGRQGVLGGGCERVRRGGVPVVGGRLFVAYSGSCGLLRLTGGEGGAVGGAVCAACGAALQGDGVSGGGGGGHGVAVRRGGVRRGAPLLTSGRREAIRAARVGNPCPRRQRRGSWTCARSRVGGRRGWAPRSAHGTRRAALRC